MSSSGGDTEPYAERAASGRAGGSHASQAVARNGWAARRTWFSRGQLLLPYDVFGFGLADGGRIPFSRRYIESWA
jgi:hypothetical protein